MTDNFEKENDISHLGLIFSKTDLNGTIVDANSAFVIASGYTRQELIGQPHNILRHSDVPKAVFRDMWATLKSGKPWVQVVKNRCKDGSYYWVQANVSPLVENGKLVGYQSVRSPIDQPTKVATGEVYKEINAGRKTIKNGYIVSGFDRACLFNHFHPINIMLLMIAALGGLATLNQSGLLSLPVEYVALISLAFLGYAWAGKKYVFNRLGRAKLLIDKMREGDFDGQVNTYGDHSLSKLVSAVKMMQIQLGAVYDQVQRQLRESKRLQAALNNASTNVMMVNQSGSIVFMNRGMTEFFESYQSEFKNIESNALLGASLSQVCEKSIFENLSVDAISEETIGGLRVKLSVITVLDDEGNLIGTVIEWLDLTQQRKIENELDNTLKMASIGHTDLQINTHNLTGFYLDTSNHVNTLLNELNAIIESMVYVMTCLAEGDIKARIEKNLQGSLAAMKGATNVSLDNLSTIIYYIKQAAETVRMAAEESSSASVDLSDRTQMAAATLEQVNASMTNMSNLQKSNTKELTEVNESAKQTVKENEKAKASLEATVVSMQGIQKTSEQIANIISLIDGIAFQTNLLALNAAVEAARAGEHGRGFAVVAGEVRNLAQKSAEAASDIKKLIDDSVSKVNEGVTIVNETNRAFEEVDVRVSNMGVAMDSVLGSIQEQQRSVSEIALAVNSLDENIQSNAALVEESSSAALSLKEQAALLNSQTGKFLIDEAKTARLTQQTGEVYGVNMSEVRQKMRIWRTTAQSYLNGISIDLDVQKAIDPTQCAVGKALSHWMKEMPQIQSMPLFKEVHSVHISQHQLVEQALVIMQQSGGLGMEVLREKDLLLDDFVKITDRLDELLLKLNYEITHAQGMDSGATRHLADESKPLGLSS